MKQEFIKFLEDLMAKANITEADIPENVKAYIDIIKNDTKNEKPILTDNGKEIYNYIKQAMNCFSSAEMQFSNLKKLGSGTLKIGASTTLARLFLLK